MSVNDIADGDLVIEYVGEVSNSHRVDARVICTVAGSPEICDADVVVGDHSRRLQEAA